jgi:mRNA-degrading endonuclease RelE of RelBE toxin-antitoxin system
MPCKVEYSPDAEEHLHLLTKREQGMVLDAVDEQLTFQPTAETRNRKPMRPNPLAPWELRVGKLRVYYDVEENIVVVLAIGIKEGKRVRIGKEVIDL